MPGTTLIHNDICINITLFLRQILKTKGSFKVQQENIKVQITENQDYTYPDVVVLNDPRDFDSQYVIKFPVVIFEVMSKSSRTEDAVDKFIRYKKIASLRHYILVDSEKKLVEVRSRLENGDWESEVYFSENNTFPVPALDLTMRLEDVYEGFTL